MRWQRFFRLAFIGITAGIAGCMQAVDPGTDQRYSVEFDASSDAAGRKFHWPTMPVRLRYSPCGVSNCTATIENRVKKGIEFWQKNASLFGEIQTVYGEPADIQISYVAPLGGCVIAKCGGTIYATTDRSKMYMAPPLSLQIATTVSGSCQPLKDSDFEFVAAHELGHCLGLWSHSPREGDLMYDTLTDNVSYSARDINSLRFLYSQNSDVGIYRPGFISPDTVPVIREITSPPLKQP